MARDDRVLRPFWLHQVAEYLLALVLIAQGLQSLTPIVPSLAGGLVLVNAAVVEGALGAFRLVPRRVHRWLDLVVIGVIVVLAALPWLRIDNAGRVLMGAIAVMLAFVWWNSSFEAARPRTEGAPVDRGEAVGRLAGRAVGGAVRAVRQRRAR